MIQRYPLLVTASVLSAMLSAVAQVDQTRAKTYFDEAAALCEREGGRLWGRSLCGPMVFADPTTRTIATNQPAPDVPRPPALGFANAALEWGATRWSTFVWPTIPADAHARARLMLHELFHRIQPELGLMTADGQNDHLDTLEGRYWLQLEWRALARALGASGDQRSRAVRDALGFRQERRKRVPGAAENERRDEIREGLAQYTGTVAAASSAREAVADAIDQLAANARNQTFVRTFAYPSGAAYGLLLDEWSPGWTRRIQAGDDLGTLLMAAAELGPTSDIAGAASRYDGDALRAAEQKRETEHHSRIAGLRRRFVEGPVLILPGAPGAFVSLGVTAIPGAGTVYPGVRVTAEWGRLEAAAALRSTDRRTITVPAPPTTEGTTLKGDGWTLELAPGWIVRPGDRPGDLQVVKGG
jgi:hypothetical protein